MHKPLVIFAHGKESGPWGSKIRHLADVAQRHGTKVLSPDYSDLPSPHDRVARLQALELPPHSRLILVGSSMGGYVSAVAASVLQPQGVFLLAPAVGMPGYPLPADLPAPAKHLTIIHGWNDDIVPVQLGIDFAKKYRAELHVLDADHRLNEALEIIGELFSAFLRRSL